MKWDPVCLRPCRGFTLVETLAVVALVAIIAVMATPSFVAWHLRDQVDARAKALASTLAYARSEALRRGARVTVCRIDAARRCASSPRQLSSRSQWRRSHPASRRNGSAKLPLKPAPSCPSRNGPDRCVRRNV